MSKTIKQFLEAIGTIVATPKGQEASMYGPIRDLFCDQLGYPKNKVHIDIAGAAGRPDVTCRAPSGLSDAQGTSTEIDWIVVEAKDERGVFLDAEQREEIFAEKSKYITPDTAWFVMVEPTVIVARPTLTQHSIPENDIVLPTGDLEDESAFLSLFEALSYDRAGVPERLKAFRDGDLSLIATDRLICADDASKRVKNKTKVARRHFYTSLRQTTKALQESTLFALKALASEINDIKDLVSEFEKVYGPIEFDPYTLRISASPASYELNKTYPADSAKLSRELKKRGSISRLALDGLPSFEARVSTKSEAQTFEMFATETANLVLARILLIRFFEDHRFFGDHRYLCNGGVQAFQGLRDTFEQGYTRLLQMAYEKAEKVYAAAFDETELDWVFFADNPNLSNAIEWAMYQLSRFDFTTVKGDILTGVYDRFLDAKQRKRFGEYYTPSSVARYILDAMDLSSNDTVLDPACGSGTFLIERYQQVIGEDVDKGLGSYTAVTEALERIYGNDLNTFSAVLAQIQLLWHALSFKDELVSKGFPDIPVSDKGNSIVRANLDVAQQGRWAEFDTLSYGGVVGNPPYVRPERAGKLDPASEDYFTSKRDKPGINDSWKGISAEANLYALFLYKALDSWCKKPDRHGLNVGKVGFVLPLAICGTNENAEIRRLFGPGGRWTITEIVDLELIWRHVFDADVLPILLIAEARPPRLPLKSEQISGEEPVGNHPAASDQLKAHRLGTWINRRLENASTVDAKVFWERMKAFNAPRYKPDTVAIKLATKDCIHFEEGVKRPSFDFSAIPPQKVDYADLFSGDGRILTRLTPARLKIVRKLEANPKFESVLQTYYYKQRGSDRGSVKLQQPKMGHLDWEKREMISRGIVFAGKKKRASRGQGHTIYKAENIVSGAIFGDAQDIEIDITKARNRYLFAFQEILPKKMWAVACIATSPNAVAFDPHSIAFTDTATCFVPQPKAANIPFDIFFISRVVRYFYVLACRMSYLNMNRSHIYPTNLRLLPWSDKLLEVENELEALRPDLISACENAFHTEAALKSTLAKLGLPTLTGAIKAVPSEKIEWSESFQIGAEKIEIANPVVRSKTETGHRIQVSKYLFDWIEVQSCEMAEAISTALNVKAGETISREDLLKLPVPATEAQRDEFNSIVATYTDTDHKAAIEAIVDRIDALIGPCLGLTETDLRSIKSDMATDPFFRHVEPRYPASETRLHGYRTGLDSTHRYS
ncbi:MAG: N-6 DNA methylase [Pseudomonadota bacterium]